MAGKLSETTTEESEEGVIKTIQTFTLKINPDDTGKNLTCTAEQNSNSNVMTASVNLNINFLQFLRRRFLTFMDITWIQKPQ